MDYLADTNIILRLAEPAHPMHRAALNAVKKLFADGHNLCLIPQNLIEFWNVATRPANKNGLGWTTAQTDAEVGGLEAVFTILPDNGGHLLGMAEIGSRALGFRKTSSRYAIGSGDECSPNSSFGDL